MLLAEFRCVEQHEQATTFTGLELAADLDRRISDLEGRECERGNTATYLDLQHAGVVTDAESTGVDNIAVDAGQARSEFHYPRNVADKLGRIRVDNEVVNLQAS